MYQLSRAYLKTTDLAQTELCEIRALETVDHEEHVLVESGPKRDVFRDKNLSVFLSKGGRTRKSVQLVFLAPEQRRNIFII